MEWFDRPEKREDAKPGHAYNLKKEQYENGVWESTSVPTQNMRDGKMENGNRHAKKKKKGTI